MKQPLYYYLFSSRPFSWSQVTTLQDRNQSESILSKMTVDEKVGQMTQMTVTNFEEKGKPGVLTWLSYSQFII
jgi:beta-glucosidase